MGARDSACRTCRSSRARRPRGSSRPNRTLRQHKIQHRIHGRAAVAHHRRRASSAGRYGADGHRGGQVGTHRPPHVRFGAIDITIAGAQVEVPSLAQVVRWHSSTLQPG
ncbi:MAG: hypothetical protein ACK559_03320, partial [bacterium]